jgi:2-polyprenyl-3-methyl-5-hydroxy-6-metoxy-1,4-benzoquinol methylase
VLSHLDKWSTSWKSGEIIRILDIGTGGADLPLSIHRWAANKKFTVEITAVDIVDDIVSIARENTRGTAGVHIEQKDFFDLAAHGDHFDYVIASLLLHHIPPARARATLQAFDALATRGIIVSDLLRSATSYFAVMSLSLLVGNYVVRHDGPLSVRRAFTPEELQTIANEAGLPYLTARREPWFRVSLAGEKEGIPLPLRERAG